MITDNSSLHFAQPIWIAIGFIVCACIIGLFVRFDRRREADLAKLIHPRFHARLTEGFSLGRRNLKRVMWLLAVLFAFSAIARPQKGYEWREVKRKGIDILFAVDTSRSMLAEDLTPTRLERARFGIIDFVARLEGDRVGLIPFAGTAFALCPLTLDYEAFRESLNALNTDLIPRQGTDLASAIKEASRLFDENGNNHRVLVLLTDGEDLQGDVIDAAKEAAKKGMAIYTVGVGSADGANIPIRHENGRKDFLRDEAGKMVKTVLDETTLKKIAAVTNGLYVPLGRGAEGLNTLYQEKLRLVPQSEQDQRMERIPLEQFEWPLGVAIGLLFLEFFISDRRRVTQVRPLTSVARLAKIPKQMMPLLLLLVFLFGISTSSAREISTSELDQRQVYNQGTQAYAKGDFAKATESLNASLRTQDLALQQRSYYNLGNTLYRTGQGTLDKDPDATVKVWGESLKAYEDSLALNSSDEDALYNKNFVQKKLEELKKQQKNDKKSKDEKKENQKDDKEKKGSEDSKGDRGSKEDQESKDEKESEDQKQSKDSKSGKESKDGKDANKEETSKNKEDLKGTKDPKEKQKSENKESEKTEEGKPEDPAGQKNEDQKAAEETQGTMSNERPQKREMTPEEAKQLLESLRQDERTVIPIPPQRRGRFATPDNSTKGKTW